MRRLLGVLLIALATPAAADAKLQLRSDVYTSKSGSSEMVALALAVATEPATPAASAAKVRKCGSVANDADTGAALNIRAKGLSCRKAKRVMRRCMNGKKIGWNVRQTGRNDPENSGNGITEYRRGKMRMYATLVGGGGCTG